MKIHWKLIIAQKFRVVFQISRPANLPQKWFSTQNGLLDVKSQIRQTPTMEASNFWRNQAKSMMHPFKGCPMVSVWFFKKLKAPMAWGQSHLKTLHTKVRFEYWAIFEGYLWAEIFENQLWTFCQSLIFNVFLYIFKIKDEKQLI